MQGIREFSRLFQTLFLLTLFCFITFQDISFGITNHEEETALLSSTQPVLEEASIRFNESSPLYQTVMGLLKPSANSDGTPSPDKEAVAEVLKGKLKELERIAPQISQEDRTLFNSVTESVGNYVKDFFSNPLELKEGQLKRSFEEIFPKDQSVFSKNSIWRPVGNSYTSHARYTLERIKSWEEKLKQESDPIKKLILTYTLHGELTTLAELRPKVISEQNRNPRNKAQEKDWRQLKGQIDQRFEEFTNLSKEQNQLPTFKLTEKEDFKYLLEYDRLLQRIISSSYTDPERKDRALSLRRAILAAFEDQYRNLKNLNQLDKQPFSDFKDQMAKLAKESETIAANIKRTNANIDFAENAKKNLRQNRDSLSKQDNQTVQNNKNKNPQNENVATEIKAAIDKVRNQAESISRNIEAGSELGPNLLQSYRDSLQQLKEQEASLKSLINQPTTKAVAVPERTTAQSTEKATEGDLAPQSTPKGIKPNSETISNRVSSFSPNAHESAASNPTKEETVKSTENSGTTGGAPAPAKRSLGREIVSNINLGMNGNRNASPSLRSQSATESEREGSENLSGAKGNAQLGRDLSGIMPFQSPGTTGLTNSAEKVASNSPAIENQKLSLENGSQDETRPSWYDNDGVSLRKKEEAIKNGKAKRNDSSNIFNYTTNSYFEPNSKLPLTNSATEPTAGSKKEVSYSLNADGTFSPVNSKMGAMQKREGSNGDQTQSAIASDSDFKKLSEQTNLINGMNLDTKDAEDLQNQEGSLLAKLGLQPTLDSLSQLLAGLLPSSEVNSTNITELLAAKDGVLRNKRFNRELSTVDPKKADKIKAVILADANSTSKDELSLWEKLLAWFRS